MTHEELEEVARSDARRFLAELRVVVGVGGCGVDAGTYMLAALQPWFDQHQRRLTDALFEVFDLDAVPPAAAVTLLACTRVQRTLYDHRDAFVARFQAWLETHGRTPAQAALVVRGLAR